MAVMLDEGYVRARQRVGAACSRIGLPALLAIVPEAYKNLDGLYAFHGDIRRGFEKGDVKLLKALRQVDAARSTGNEAFARGAHAQAALAYTAGLTPDPYNMYNDNRTPQGKLDPTPIMGGAVLLCNRAAAHAAMGRHEDALEDAATALAADDAYGKARTRLCAALIELGRGRAALTEVARLSKDKPGDPNVVGRGRCRLNPG